MGAMHSNNEYMCSECGKTSNLKALFQIDHIEPISKGGLTVSNNLQLLCRTCNLVKSDKI